MRGAPGEPLRRRGPYSAYLGAVPWPSWADAVTLSASRNHAISTRRRRVTRTTCQSARLVPATAASLCLGCGTAPAQRTGQDAIRGDHPEWGKPSPEPTSPGGSSRKALLARWRRSSPTDLPGSDPVPPLVGCAGTARPAPIGRGAGGVFRSECFAGGMREVSGDGRYADPTHLTFRALSSDQTETYRLANLASRQSPVVSVCPSRTSTCSAAD